MSLLLRLTGSGPAPITIQCVAALATGRHGATKPAVPPAVAEVSALATGRHGATKPAVPPAVAEVSALATGRQGATQGLVPPVVGYSAALPTGRAGSSQQALPLQYRAALPTGRSGGSIVAWGVLARSALPTGRQGATPQATPPVVAYRAALSVSRSGANDVTAQIAPAQLVVTAIESTWSVTSTHDPTGSVTSIESLNPTTSSHGATMAVTSAETATIIVSSHILPEGSSMGIPLRQPVKIIVEFRDENNALVDPSDDVVIAFLDPEGNRIAYKYTLAQVTKLATGRYQYVFKSELHGSWWYKWVGTGTNEGISGDYEIPVDATKIPWPIV